MKTRTPYHFANPRPYVGQDNDSDNLTSLERLFRCGAGCASLLIPLVAAVAGDGITQFITDIFPLLPPLLAASIYAIVSGISGQR